MNFTTISFLVTLIALIYLYLKVKSLEAAHVGHWFLLNSLAKQIVKNIDHIRQFTTQVMLIAGSLAVFSINTIEGPAVKIKEFFTGAFVLLLVVVGFGAYQLKSILERENNQLEAQNKDYIDNRGSAVLTNFWKIIQPTITIRILYSRNHTNHPNSYPG